MKNTLCINDLIVMKKKALYELVLFLRNKKTNSFFKLYRILLPMIRKEKTDYENISTKKRLCFETSLC